MNEQKYHQKRIERRPVYRAIADAIIAIDNRHPTLKGGGRNVVDLGSSCGVLLSELEGRKHWNDLCGVEVSYTAAEMWCCKRAVFAQHDLDKPYFSQTWTESPVESGVVIAPRQARPFPIDGLWDWIICMEVAEHMTEPKYLYDLICNCLSYHGILLFSAAIPGQRGSGHVSCHWPEWWQRRFVRAGLRYDHMMTSQFLTGVSRSCEKAKIELPAYYRRAMIFRAAHIPGVDGGYPPRPDLDNAEHMEAMARAEQWYADQHLTPVTVHTESAVF